MNEQKIRARHFLRPDGRLNYPPHTGVVCGKTISVDCKPVMCEQGLHGSIRLIDALQYAPGPILCRVDIWGDVKEGGDKLVGQNRHVIWMQDITTTLHEFACDEAERALTARREAGDEPDPRSWAAIEAKRKWLRGEISDDDLDATRYVARVAAWAAAWEAKAAAWAARVAARTTVRDATRAAAGAGAEAAQNERLESIVFNLGAPR